MSRNVVSFLKRHPFTCHSSSLFHSRKDAVPCDVILYFTQAALLPQSINDSSDLARSSIKKLQSHITLPFTAVFTLPSLQEYFFLCPSSQQRSQADQCWGAAALAAFPISENIKPHLFFSIPTGTTFSESMATACCHSHLPSRTTSAFCHPAPPCQLQWETLSLH